jgi:Ca-activated chloride channel family protein
MEMFRFANPEFFWGFLIIPLLLGLFVYARIQRRKALSLFGSLPVMEQLMPSVSKSRPISKFIILMLALSFFIFGLARPQFGSKLKTVKRQGVELMIALDVSNSMMAEDIEPNRLERAKRAIARLIDRLRDDKIGLIVFAGQAYTQLPITSDYNSAKLFLNSINPEFIPVQGTAVGAAVDLATKSFTPSPESSKAIIIITDGENHEDDAVGAAKAAAEKGIIVHTIGMGLPQGAPIPVMKNGQKDYRKDNEGKTVITKLDEQMLEEISAAGKGIYIRANNAQVGLDTLFDEINKMQKSEMESKTYSEYDDQFQYFFGIGLILMLLEFLILERKNRYLRNIHLFKTTK